MVLQEFAYRQERAVDAQDIQQTKPDVDILGMMMDFEEGNLEGYLIPILFQKLVDNGMAWKLQGSYGRIARGMINAGCIHE